MQETISRTLVRIHTTNGKKEEEVKPPKYYCKSCDNRCGNRCELLRRPIVADYNKCFNHSNYSPVNIVELPKNEVKKSA